MSDADRRGFGRRARTAISSQVVTAILLAAAAAVLVTWLAARPELRGRIDLTAMKSNTLDDTLGDLIRALPERASIEVFFRPVDPPLTAVGAEAQQKMSELLFVARNEFPDKLRVELHDLSDVAKASLRMKELDVHEDNVVVVSLGGRKAVLKLLRDIARVDPGNPTLRAEPRLESFRGEEALGNALLSVSIEDAPKIVFTGGHGEMASDLSRLFAELASDGFRVERWDMAQSPALPQGTRVVAIVDAHQPLLESEQETIAKFVRGGGRLLVASTLDDKALGAAGSAESLLERFGIRVQSGLVAQPIPDGFGGLRTGSNQCGTFLVAGTGLDRRHPITEALARSDSRVVLPGARSLEPSKDNLPPNAILVDVLRSQLTAWRDLPDVSGHYDWTPGQTEELASRLGMFPLAMALSFAPTGEASAADPSERPAARVVALTSPGALGNDFVATDRDFVLNTFNWLAARDRRLAIRPRATEHRMLDIANTHALAWLNGLSTFALPGVCGVLGLVLALRRRR